MALRVAVCIGIGVFCSAAVEHGCSVCVMVSSCGFSCGPSWYVIVRGATARSFYKKKNKH
jgi:hypothetical protein